MEFEAALFAEIPQGFEPRAVRGGVELGGHHDHRFFRQGFAEGCKLAVDDFEGADRVIRVGIARINQVDKKARAFDVAEEADAEASAQVCALDQPGEIGDDKRAPELGAVPTGAPVGIDDAEIGFKRREWVVRNFRACR
jgi:hypothetical protein